LQKTEYPGICYGGRYSIPTSAKKEESFPGVGATINLTLLFDYLVDKEIVITDAATIAPIMVSSIASVGHVVYLAKRIRESGVQVELFLENTMSIEDQMEYAKNRGFKVFSLTNRLIFSHMKKLFVMGSLTAYQLS